MKKSRKFVMENNIALILLAHGSKDIKWKKPFVSIKDELQREGLFTKVDLAFFELDTPLLEDVVDEYQKKGLKKIKIEPLLLASGYHIQKDLPNRLKKLKLQFNNLDFTIGTALIDRGIISKAVASSIIDEHLKKKVHWLGDHGKAINSAEKIKVLDHGLDNILSDIKNFLETAILMGCSEKLTKQKIISNLQDIQS